MDKTVPVSDSRRDRNRIIGIGLFVTAQFCAAWQAGFSKLGATELPVMMVVWGRFTAVLFVALVVALFTVTRADLIPNRPWLHILRGSLLVLASFSYVTATTRIPLANAIAVAFVYPFLVTALAPAILKERVTGVTWVIIVAGFIGVLIVVRPGMDGFEPYAFLALLAGVCFAVVLVLTSILAPRAPAVVTVLWTALTATIITTVFVPLIWKTPTPYEWGILALAGGFAACGNMLQLAAAKRCEMSVLAPFGYSEMITTAIIGIIMFGDFPDSMTWLGIGVIMVSGLAMMFRR